jgi:protein-arginine kinase activator protein McsA
LAASDVASRADSTLNLVEEEVRLKEELKRAVEREDFELAAELRDRLKAMPIEAPAETPSGNKK